MNQINRKSPHQTTISKMVNPSSKSSELLANENIISPRNKYFWDLYLKKNLRNLSQKIKVHGWKSSRTVEYNFSGVGSIQSEGLRDIGLQVIGYFSHVEKLKVKVSNCESFEDQNLNAFFAPATKRLPRLSCLDVEFLNSNISDYGLKDIANQIGNNIKNLRCLNINFSNSKNITGLGVQWLSKRLSRNQKHLERLRINFGGFFKKRDQKTNDLYLFFKPDLPKLQYLDFSLKKCRNTEDLVLRKLASHIGFNSKNLRCLNLDFNSCVNITDETLQVLGSSISQNLVDLRILKINLSNCTLISDEGVQVLSLQIAKISNLAQLELDFSSLLKVTDKGVKCLSDNLCRLSKLQELVLHFSYCDRVSDQGIQILSSQIAQNLQNLTALNLAFVYCANVSDTGVKSLSDNISSKLLKLQKLVLIFSCCSMVTDLAVDHMCQRFLENLKALQFIELSFSGCEYVTEKAKNSARYCLNHIADYKIF